MIGGNRKVSFGFESFDWSIPGVFFLSSQVLFCLAALVFPIGFYVDEIGGRPYKLPASTQVGSSYVLFVMSIFFTIISELFAGKVCLPVF